MWKPYIEAGVPEPYQVAHLQFGEELDEIPEPPEMEMPEVKPAEEDR